MTDFDQRREEMVRRQLAGREIANPKVLEAMREVPRELFVPEHLRSHAYDDGPLPIGEAQTISQPYILAAMIEAAGIEPGDRVLEVGAGSGYAAAVLSRIAAQVFAIERHASLAEKARQRIEQLGYDNCTIHVGDGCEGLPQHAPFDAIIVAARAKEVPPPLLAQLAPGGRLIMPIGGEAMQDLVRVQANKDGTPTRENVTKVRFVPLVRGTAG